ncbi:phospho-sugar mutase [Thalassobacillus sp. CUG 92003]|uniref:phospho-sugar mutase n=1 Tax=Thalassobacillus sp. CUG 92003 TaxID=2736641 RepID=UPI0015E683D3|nr:phospho-sugar mutase [Thalassobacillus sp. CUG 92003]
MNWNEQYNRWNNFSELDDQLRSKLTEMQEDELSLEDAFYKNLEFGTGGMRGKLGPGTNRMNIYTIRRAAEGMAHFIADKGKGWKSKGVVIAYDSRYMSQEFAIETARVLGRHGIQSYVFTSLRPTPELSFAVRFLQAAAGVMVTASHNPPEYNGFKVYNEDGGQLPPAQAEVMIDFVNQVENELSVDAAEQATIEENGLLEWIDDKVDRAYLKELRSVNFNPQITHDQIGDFNVVFSPLHGTARMLVEAGFEQIGLADNYYLVEEQQDPDPEFSTVDSPNPEEHQAFALAIEKGKAVNADVLIATDPDADRLGIAVPDGAGDYTVLTGNQTGALMLDYILSQEDDLPDNGLMLKTIVTSEFGRAIAEHYNIATEDTLTGFKFIGEKIREYERTGEYEFLFGYEESYGYLIKDFARDKDAVQSVMLAAEMAVYWKAKGKTLLEALYDLYDQHGYYLEDLQSLKLEGKVGVEKIQSIMENFREAPMKEAGGINVTTLEDYATSTRWDVQEGSKSDINLPKENVLKFILEDNSWFCLRPSGTEPKIKFYYGVKMGSKKECDQRLLAIKQTVNDKLNTLT